METKKVALLFICLNAQYWPFLKQVIEDARVHFLKNQNVEFFVWSDMPELDELPALLETLPTMEEIEAFPPERRMEAKMLVSREEVKEAVEYLRAQEDIHIFYTDPAPWPFPTLMRYHIFLGQEEALADFDYLYYLDVDMRIVDTVGDEILGEGLMMAEHPMYSLRREYIPPYEPNRGSQAYIPRTGVVVKTEQGQPYFKPLYAAGGFQGGAREPFITAMQDMKKSVDTDFMNNYVAIWNDESHWNKYLYTYEGPMVVLSPSYVYPDSLVDEYYVKVWGKKYKPIIITLTKKFTTTPEAGDELRKRLTST